jgi:glycosyltransferase involved in cell wall biosynthesis
MATVAIIIPAYNAASYLGPAIDSALGQTLPAAQVIVVDDGSTDHTELVAGRYEDAVIYLRQENAGVSAARNHGAAAAVGDWLLFLDADDLLKPHALERLTARAEQGEFGVVYGQTVYFREGTDERRLHGKGAAEGRVPAAMVANFWKSVVATPGAAIIKRSLFDAVEGFRREFNTAADRDLWMRAGMLAEFGFVEEPVIEKREHDANMSGNKSRARQQAAEVQLSFLSWCDKRGLARPAFDEREILERNLERALAERSFPAAEWLCAEANHRGVSGPLFTRAERLLGMPAFARDLELRARSYFQK